MTQEKLALDEAQKIAHSISVEVATDEAKIERRQEIGKLISLARDRGMVESKNGQTLFINENVAFIPE